MNPKTWTWAQWCAAGRNLLSFTAGGVAMAVMWRYLTQADASAITQNINTIADGIAKIAEGVAGLIAVLTPIYTAWKASHAASPNAQAASIAVNAGRITNGARLDVINAVGQMPEVKKVVTTTAVAEATPSNKVTAQ
jgi:hypothetical protein